VLYITNRARLYVRVNNNVYTVEIVQNINCRTRDTLSVCTPRQDFGK